VPYNEDRLKNYLDRLLNLSSQYSEHVQVLATEDPKFPIFGTDKDNVTCVHHNFFLSSHKNMGLIFQSYILLLDQLVGEDLVKDGEVFSFLLLFPFVEVQMERPVDSWRVRGRYLIS